MGLDFSQLYSQLNLRPDCTLAELKHAYRKRIAELHPDRHASEVQDEAESARLAALISLYKMAVHFHHLHGRLPGSTGDGNDTQGAEPHQPAARRPSARGQPDPARGRGPSSTGGGQWWILAILMLLLAYVVLSRGTSTPAAVAPEAQPTRAPSAAVPGAAGPRAAGQDAAYLRPGMNEATVLSIQGQPVRIDDDVWEYGPSWIRFERGRLVEWHNSPLYRLKTPEAGDDQ